MLPILESLPASDLLFWWLALFLVVLRASNWTMDVPSCLRTLAPGIPLNSDPMADSPAILYFRL